MAGIYSATETAAILSQKDKLVEYRNMGIYGVLHGFSRSTGRLLCTIDIGAAYSRIAHYRRIPLNAIHYLGNRSRFVDAWITGI